MSRSFIDHTDNMYLQLKWLVVFDLMVTGRIFTIPQVIWSGNILGWSIHLSGIFEIMSESIVKYVSQA